jgi:hypothetical protein
MRRSDVEGELFDQARQPGRLTPGQVQHQSRQRGGVDDRVLERALEAATHKPRVEGVVAVLDQDGAVGKPQERAAGVLELRRADEHRAVDVMTPAGVRVDRRSTVDERVEERKGPIEPEPFGTHLEDQEGRIAGRFDVEGDELRVFQQSLRFDLGRVDCDLLPRHEAASATWLEEERPGAHRAIAIARLAQLISSRVTARSPRTATP